MSKRRLIKATFLTAALSPFFLTSCVDDSYDLSKDIDMNITIGGDLSIPGSSTEEFTLKDIMDLEDNSVILTDEQGNYALSKIIDADPTLVTIDPVNINAPRVNPTKTILTFDAPFGINQEVQAQVQDVRMDFEFQKDNVTTDIISLTSADVDFSAALTLGFEDRGQSVEQITFKKGFTVRLEVDGQNTAERCITFDLEDTENYRIKDGEPQTIEFLKDITVMKGNTLEIPVHFTRINRFPEGQGLYESGKFRFKTNIIANGTAVTPGLPEGNITVNLENSARIPEISLESVTGTVDPEINISIDPIEVEGIPDFLKDNVNLDLTNPYIKLKINNESPLTVNVNAHMRWIRNRVTANGFPIGTSRNENTPGKTILLEGNKISEYYLSRRRLEGIDTKYNIIVGEDLYEAMRIVPDQIELTNIEAQAVQEDITVDLHKDGATYDVNTTYELYAPLQFGDELSIVYTDTINDWGGDLEDVVIRKAIVEMDVLNGIPLNFTIDAKAIDVNGNEYSNVLVNPVSNHIKPGLKLAEGADEGVTESKIQLEIICENGEMKDLDGLIVTFTGNREGVSNNVTLNESMTLKITNMRVRIKGGVTVDMN